MKEKKDNNLVKLTTVKGVHYFTSTNRCAIFLNTSQSVIDYNIRNNKGIIKNLECTVEIVDGSEVKYKDIN